MDAMPYGDDLDARFNDLVAQFSEEELRRMRAVAARGARRSQQRSQRRPQRHSQRRSQGRGGRIAVGWYALAAVLAVLLAAALIVLFRPDLLAPAPQPVHDTPAPVLRAAPSST